MSKGDVYLRWDEERIEVVMKALKEFEWLVQGDAAEIHQLRGYVRRGLGGRSKREVEEKYIGLRDYPRR